MAHCFEHPSVVCWVESVTGLLWFLVTSVDVAGLCSAPPMAFYNGVSCIN